MSEFLHRLAEELRVREQYLEDHSSHPAFADDPESHAAREYDRLVAELKAFVAEVDKAREAGKDFAKHFEKDLKEKGRLIQLRIDSWAKTLK
ncbi:MAG: hypothetical protein EP335_04695 [Alphaproteobacteria bacterium]|nr:MAG: hypothetical protein EP335_04695 [Alphaproteobacteria bacterium]